MNIEARNLIALMAAEELKELNITFKFDQVNKNKSCLRIRGNSLYTYQRLKRK